MNLVGLMRLQARVIAAFKKANPRFVDSEENAWKIMNEFRLRQHTTGLRFTADALTDIFLDLAMTDQGLTTAPKPAPKPAPPDVRILVKETSSPPRPAVPAAPDPEAIRTANEVTARRFVLSLDADAYDATLAANPTLAQALDGQLDRPLDISQIKIITPEKVERFAGVDIERSRYAKQLEDRDRAREHAAVRETQRGSANAFRGSASSEILDRKRQ